MWNNLNLVFWHLHVHVYVIYDVLRFVSEIGTIFCDILDPTCVTFLGIYSFPLYCWCQCGLLGHFR